MTETTSFFVALILAVFAGVALVAHLGGLLITAIRAARPRPIPTEDAPAVSILRTIHGAENCLEATLASTFRLNHPRDRLEILFCVADAQDPAAALARRLIARHPEVDARLLVGREAFSTNPKLTNIAKGWRAARHDWIVMADSNVLMPPDYIARLLAQWGPGVGLVASPPVGCRPEGLAAELECAFLNSHQARWQVVADTLGHGFAQGKTMLWRREILEQAGGIEALAAEPAEDAAATKLVRGLGLKIRLVDAPFRQPLGRRSLAAVWNRQLRWSRLRRQTFPAQFGAEIVSGGLPPLLAIGVAAGLCGLSVPMAVAGLALVWYGAETLFARRIGWPLSAAAPALFLIRDALLPAIWIGGLAGRGIEWQGQIVVPEKPALTEGRA